MSIDEFTFHYVSIKSKSDSNTRLFSSTFTFHYVSIKSNQTATPDYSLQHLHSTMYLLNLDGVQQLKWLLVNLHSTMYLLNLPIIKINYIRHKKFTFHYVSIKSSIFFSELRLYLLYLHSTMYLLNQDTESLTFDTLFKFTFHYVSIKSYDDPLDVCPFCHLHSTMYLLNRQRCYTHI